MDGEGSRMSLAGCESCESEASCVGEELVHLWMFLVNEGCPKALKRVCGALFISLLLRCVISQDRQESTVLSDPSTSGAYLSLAFSRGLGLLDHLRYVPKTLERHVIRQGVGQGFTRQLLRVNVAELE